MYFFQPSLYLIAHPHQHFMIYVVYIHLYVLEHNYQLGVVCELLFPKICNTKN